MRSLLVVLLLVVTSQASPRVTTVDARHGPTIRSGDVTLIWYWGLCLKSVEALDAIAKVQVRFAADSHVHVTTVMVDDVPRAKVEKLIGSRAPLVETFHDTTCRTCSLIPAEHWNQQRESLRRSGAPAETIDSVGTEPGLPTWIVIDGNGKSLVGEGMELGMTMDQLADGLAGIVAEARAGRLASAHAPSIDWKLLSPAARAKTKALARAQLLRWLKIPAKQADDIVAGLDR